MKAYPKDFVEEKETTNFRKGVGKLLHMMKRSRPEIYSIIRDPQRHMNEVIKYHINSILRAMRYVVSTPTPGWKLKLEIKWDGNNCALNFKIK